MKRRALLASAGVGMVGLSGCLFGGGGDDQTTETTAAGEQPVRNVNKSGAQLQLVSISAPDSIELNQRYSFELTVRNAGDTAGVYRAPVSVQRGDSVEFKQEREALVYVEPGENQTATVEISSFSEVGRVNIRLDGAANQWGVDVTQRRLPFGGSFSAGGFDITVDRVELADSYTGRNGGEVSPRGDRQWAFVYVTVTNTGSQDFAPGPELFRLLYNGTRFSKAQYGSRSPEYESVNLRSGQTEAGIIQYSVPSTATVGDIAVEYDRRGRKATWVRVEGDSSGAGAGNETTASGSRQEN